ncbi:MAG: biotin--[acetyl-CoA-carboxylase] ligase [Actinomycetota bacterium]
MGSTPLSLETLAGIWNRAGLEAPVRFDEVTGSTNATASELARHGAPEWAVVAAAHQTRGRGRLGRVWADRPGASLLCSIVLRPAIRPAEAGVVSLLAAVALAEAADASAGAAAGCKWPNDVLVEGRKAAGILVEGAVDGERVDHLVLGFGVNLDEPPVEGAGAIRAGPAVVLDAFLEAFVPRYRPADPDFARTVVGLYRPWCLTLGRLVRATILDGDTIEGEAVDLDDRGGLLVESGGRTVTVAFGEVEHLRPGAGFVVPGVE